MPDQVMAEQARLLDEYGFGQPARNVEVRDLGIKPSLGERFHGEKPANIPIQSEKGEHRLIVYLKARGYSNREIAKSLGYTESWISQITRQPWFRERLDKEMREAHLDPVEQFLKSEALPALQTLADIRDNTELPASSRVAAANSILDRTFGKPTQHIKSETKIDVNSAAKTADSIQEELKSIDEQLRARGQPGIN